jgi:hypothetical protein
MSNSISPSLHSFFGSASVENTTSQREEKEKKARKGESGTRCIQCLDVDIMAKKGYTTGASSHPPPPPLAPPHPHPSEGEAKMNITETIPQENPKKATSRIEKNNLRESIGRDEIWRAFSASFIEGKRRTRDRRSPRFRVFCHKNPFFPSSCPTAFVCKLMCATFICPTQIRRAKKGEPMD